MDIYDIIEWLIYNIYNNGNVGIWGISYDGFYVIMIVFFNYLVLKVVFL